jgi:catechol 2,3-dioxygenase-like lactoylglutathione lyase family enzyme
MIRPRRILETAIYSDDAAGTAQFYQRLLALPPILQSERLVALDAGEGTVLLVFQKGQTTNGLVTPEGLVPGHDGSGPVHLAFAIDTADIHAWESRLQTLGVAIESRVTWESGGSSIYFRDPEGRSVELATPGTWPTY